MPYPIDRKLIVVLTSIAFFDLSESYQIFKDQSVEVYRKFHEDNINECFPKGVTFPFVKRLPSLNKVFEQEPVKVVLLSWNSPENGLRAFRYRKQYGLDITCEAFFLVNHQMNIYPHIIFTILSAEEIDEKKSN